MNQPTICVVNASTVVNDAEAWNIAWSVNYQVRWHFAPRWFLSANVIFVPGGSKAKTPVGAWVIKLVNHSSVKGALGWHDEDGNLVPITEVACQDAVDDGTSACEVASHEALEMLLDPHVYEAALDPKTLKLYALEVCDPVQGEGYDVGAPQGKKTGFTVAAFVTPAYWDANTKTQLVAYPDRALPAGAAFQLARGGYCSFVDLNDVGAGWQQALGSHRSALPAWATRSHVRVSP